MSGHALEAVRTFERVRVGWQSLREGGLVPTHQAVTPYFRAYCECGAVTGKRSTKQGAEAAHARHVTAEEEAS